MARLTRSLDDTDRQIVMLLQDEARTSNQSIAKRWGSLKRQFASALAGCAPPGSVARPRVKA